MEKRTIIISGILGQIASYAADLYLSKGFRVVGLYRRSSTPYLGNIIHNMENPDFILREADICDQTSITNVIKENSPIYAFLNFAAQSHVATSYDQPITTTQIDYIAVITILEAIRLTSPGTKFWNACTSERVGNNKTQIQNEDLVPCPVSPYACAKVASEYIIKSYRDTYKMHASFSIMFNSESPRRSKAFVTRKITDWIGYNFNVVEKYIAEEIRENGVFISIGGAFQYCLDKGYIKKLRLGNLNAERSWTHASDTVEGIYRQVELDTPEIFVIGVPETHSIRDFLTEAFGIIQIKDWQNFVMQDQKFIRPSEVDRLIPDCSKIERELNWEPKVSFSNLVREMVENDIQIHSKYGKNV